MMNLELLAPARDAQIGIAAISCGADAVYIAGPQFGARQAAGNTIDDIRQLCSYAHRYGARIFVALNTILYDDELEAAYRQMLAVQEAGADALIVQDMAVLEMARKGIGGLYKDFRIPLHASTQCAIRTPEQAAFLESLGFSRLILERELSTEQIKAIRAAVSCELEFFVHGALCVCYSGQCYLSELIAGRSANRGACIQACRSRYDLTDASGKVLVRDKALLSLKDYNLRGRLEELAEAGITSFKIEGRLKNASYVKNVVQDYSSALDKVVRKKPGTFARASSGSVSCGFTPDTSKTFNRGYTELFIDGQRGRWASMDAAKSMGEEIGTVRAVGRDGMTVDFCRRDIILNNGDGFSFVTRDGSVTGFRGDVCNGNSIRCRSTDGLFAGARIFRNINAAFEKELDRQPCVREIGVVVNLSFSLKDGIRYVEAQAESEDGRKVSVTVEAGNQEASNKERMAEIFRNQIGKTSGHYRFRSVSMDETESLPFMSASSVNGIRRALAEKLDSMPCLKKEILRREIQDVCKSVMVPKDLSYKYNVSNRLAETVYREAGAEHIEPAYELAHQENAELMRTRYCIRHELGICPKYHKVKDSGPLFLINNGRRLALHFDCLNCEMTVTEPQK
ncbi:MAG: U32 family peptidase [Bacteroidales bacterium]|nr:U32 family peptidase [Bacteroidales bacterium]